MGQTITKWASGKQAIGGSPNRAQIAYGGSPLVFGSQYRWQIRLWNRDDVASTFTANLFFAQREAIGPVIVPGGTATKLNTLTPSFTLTDPGGALIDQHRVRWYSPGGALLRDTGVVTTAASASKIVVTTAGTWDWGQEPMLDAAIRIAGNADMGPTSEKISVHLNAIPGAPYPLSVNETTALQRADGSWVVDDATPTLTIPFRDTDRDLGYVEAPIRREVEIRTTTDTHITGSPFIATTGITDSYVTPTLTNETTYKIRARYDDNAAVRSEWSEYLIVKRSSVPTLTGVTPAAGAALTDPTPTIAWTFASAGGKAQARYRVKLDIAGATIYDSREQAGAASSFRLGPGILPTGASVTWTLQVWDTDGLSATVTRTFTTSFTQPAALTGFTVVPDLDVKALILSWTASALTTDEFEAYLVYARGTDGPFELVATLTDKATPTYTYRGAEHNTAVEVRVTQTNGWMESAAVEGTGQVTVEGYWWLRPDPVELRYVGSGGFNTRPVVRTEEHEPMAGGRIVLTWGNHGDRWSVRLQLPEQDDGVLRALRADMAAGVVGILKTPRAQSFYSKLIDVPGSHQAAGFEDVTISGSEVGREAAQF
ncbi:MAG: hypothetical protein H0V50_00790 [Thermoleophilaceae bacterium]|nr:hypothetical protein [Thermoleophilaceae bacterium]